MSYRVRQKNTSHLFTIHQKDGESLNQVVQEVEDPSDSVVIMAMIEGFRSGSLFDSLSKSISETLSALQSKVVKYIAAKELAEAKHRRQGKDDHKRKEPNTRRTDYRGELKIKMSERDVIRQINERCPQTPPCQTNQTIPPLNAPIVQVLMEIKNEDFVM